jgi:hypothetical protein
MGVFEVIDMTPHDGNTLLAGEAGVLGIEEAEAVSFAIRHDGEVAVAGVLDGFEPRGSAEARIEAGGATAGSPQKMTAKSQAARGMIV